MPSRTSASEHQQRTTRVPPRVARSKRVRRALASHESTHTFWFPLPLPPTTLAPLCPSECSLSYAHRSALKLVRSPLCPLSTFSPMSLCQGL